MTGVVMAMSAGVTPPSPTDIDTSAIVQGMDANFWAFMGITLAFGALGGLVYELINLRGTVEWPHRFVRDEDPQPFPYAVAGNVFDLGFLARMLVGAGAAVAVTLFVAPSNTLKLVATALLTGSAGSSIFGALQDRILAQLKQKDNANLLSMNSQVRARMQTALDSLPQEMAPSPARIALTEAIAISESAERLGH